MRVAAERAMYARARRMLLRHHPQQRLSKAEIARNLGVSHRMIDQRIGAGQFIPELDDGPARYGPTAPALNPPSGVPAFFFQPETVGTVISFTSTATGSLNGTGSTVPKFLDPTVSVAFPREAPGKTDLIHLREMLLRELGRSAPEWRLALSGLLNAQVANLQRLLFSPFPPSSGFKARSRRSNRLPDQSQPNDV